MDLECLLTHMRRLDHADRRRLLAAVSESLRGSAMVAVSDAQGRPLHPCFPRRASELVARGRARWLAPGVSIELTPDP